MKQTNIFKNKVVLGSLIAAVTLTVASVILSISTLVSTYSLSENIDAPKGSTEYASTDAGLHRNMILARVSQGLLYSGGICFVVFAVSAIYVGRPQQAAPPK